MAPTDPTLHLHAVLEPRGPAAALVLTDEQVAVFGAGRTPPVRVTIGEVTVAARVGRMGGENLVGFSRARRAELGVEIGAEVDAVVTLDAAPGQLEVPAVLEAALGGDPAARTAFDALAPSHRKEYARWIGEAKRGATRTARVEQTLQRLHDGRTG